MKTFPILFILFAFSTTCYSQSGNSNIDPKWDKYYETFPSGIEVNYSSSDFIKVLELVNFIPQGNLMKNDFQLCKKVLLSLPPEGLKQLSITGNYYSRTIKHDDYYELYNLTYKHISKDIWDKYCPYLLPIMDVDGTVRFH